MRDALKLLLMLPIIIGAAFLGIVLVGLSTAVDAMKPND